MDYKTFTLCLKDYVKNVDKINEVKEELDIILYEMSGVKGIRYDNIRGSYNPYLSALKSLEMIEKYNEKENELKYYESAIQSVDIIFKRLPKYVRFMLIDKFVKGMTYAQIGRKYGYSDNGAWHHMKTQTERYL